MENKTEKKFYAFLILALLAAAFILGYFFSGYRTAKYISENKAVPVADTLALEAQPLKNQDIQITKTYVGYVTPIHEAQIQPYINGYLQQIKVKGGQFVQKGDVLIVLQQNEYIAQLDAAKADIVKAEATYTNAQTYFERIEKAGVKAVSKTEIDNARAQFLEAQAALEQAKANYALAEVNYNYTIMRAPIDGVIGDVSLTEGNYVSPSSGSLFSIVQYSPIRVVFSVTDKEFLQETDKSHPFDGDEISVRLADGSVFPNKGVFKYTDNTVNRATNSVAVYTEFDNQGRVLTPNAYVTVLVQRTFKNAVSLPKNLVTLAENGNFIFIIRNGKLLKEEIKILASEDTRFVAADTFQPGDYLVTQNVNVADTGKTVHPSVASAQKGA